jgi:3-deoxy-D-manno-octulosonate 8-phosphate phosphatase (KDO 8-P phosphatase)
MRQQIKHLVLDVDGTLTDGKVYMGASGELMKAFNIKDGYGIHDMLIPAGITPIIITGRDSAIVTNRALELGIAEVHQGIRDKLGKMKELLSSLNGKLQYTAYIGDDLNDLVCMKAVKGEGGLVGCPADAASEVKEICNYVCKKKGGDGAVREFIEYILGGSSF